MSPGFMDVWYLTDQTLCNFDCDYCVTQSVRRSVKSKMWKTNDSEPRFRRILEWLGGLPWNLRVRLQTLGEPFVSLEFLAGAARLSRQHNVQFVELLTNGSFREEQFRKFAAAADIKRITLWMTYHSTQVSAESLVERAMLARSLGAFVIIHSLIFPDNQEKIDHLNELCREKGIPTDVTAGHNYNDAYGKGDFIPVLRTDPKALLRYRNKAALKAMLVAHKAVNQQMCSAGHDYIFIRSDGEVFPCGAYGMLSRGRLGSALDPLFVPSLQSNNYSPCQNTGVCSCKEDYFHLKIARLGLRMGPSLGYYEPEEPPGVQPVADEAQTSSA
jgi:MoaA/NifB/PqqE/SkfB family radical SAM enzyme